jgi:hypothetical protein
VTPKDVPEKPAAAKLRAERMKSGTRPNRDFSHGD